MTSELKPCPFCGGKAQRMGHAGGVEFFCGNQDCIIQPCNHSTNERDALTAWNTRAVPDVPELERYTAHDRGVAKHPQGKYVLHSQAAEIIAAKDAEIAVGDVAIKQNALLWKRAEAAEAKLAQYEAQKPFGYVVERNSLSVDFQYEPLTPEDIESGIKATPVYTALKAEDN